ncbi:hypothetical protein PSPO01_08677 [Paraphaeosphaeria sporulosa]
MSDEEYLSDEEWKDDAPTFLSLKEAQQKSQDLVKSIFGHQTFLRGILERHEAEIRRLWDKKPFEKKRAILLGAFKDMPAISRPDLELWLKREAWLEKTIDPSQAYMWPQLNSHDLVKQNMFLVFLNSRGRHFPHEFVDADLETVQFGQLAGAIAPVSVSGYAMTLHGATNSETYGRLVPCAESEGLKQAIVGLAGVDSGYGLKVLEIQDRILKFLKDCCKIILQHVKDPLSADVESEPVTLKAMAIEYASLHSTASEMPYCVPAQVNFDQVLGYICAEKDQKEEMIMTLREDPEAFADALKENGDHQYEFQVNSWGEQKVVPLEKKGDHSKFWNTVILRTLDGAYSKFAMFSQLLQWTKKLRDEAQHHSDLQWPMVPVNTDLSIAYQSVRYILGKIESGMGPALAMSIAVSPTLRDTIEVTYEEDPEGRKTANVINNSSNPKNRATQLFVELLRLLFAKDEVRIRTLHVILNDLVQLTGKDDNFKELVSPRVVADLSTLLVIAECQRQLYHFRPWTWMAEREVTTDDHTRAAYDAAFIHDWTMNAETCNNLYVLGTPTYNRFNCPPDRRHTAFNVDTLHQHVLNQQGKTYQDLIADYLSIKRSIRRTPAWTEPTDSSRSTELVPYEYIPILTTKHEQENQITGAFDRSLDFTPRSKEKRRPTADRRDEPDVGLGGHHDQDPGNNEEEVPEPANPTEFITIDRRTHQIVESLFFSPLNEKPPGEVPWSEFLRAMSKIGFAVKLGGSAWHFTPDKHRTGMDEPINFHDPHKSRLPATWARKIGHRLTTKYGWTAETFVVE